MLFSELKSALKQADTLQFQLPDKSFVPAHFHVTEIGIINKQFIDCGGQLRESKAVSFQLWFSHDVDHRLAPEKLLAIIDKAEEQIDLSDCEIEVEYQLDTIGKFGLVFDGSIFKLTTTHTDCLAKEACAPAFVALEQAARSCSPGSGCC